MAEQCEKEILKLYAYLEKIASTEDNDINDINGLENHFENCFPSKTEDPHKKIKLGLLQNAEFLTKGKIERSHRLEINAEDTGDTFLNGDSLLLRAMSINVKKNSPRKGILDKIIKCIIKYCPGLISFEKIHENSKGVTPVHLAIVQEDKKLLEIMADTLNKDVDTSQQKAKLKRIHAESAIFQDTVMMAGTLLGVASLKFNEEIFCILLKNFVSELDATNEKGDNIIHSLIKYAHIKPATLELVLKMVSFILDCQFIKRGSKYEGKKAFFWNRQWTFRKQVCKLLMMTNKEKLTPLQLAAKRQQFKIFDVIIHHEVYLSRESNDGLFNEETYDITEIDTLAIESDVNASHVEDIKTEHHESVLEYVLHHQTNNAFLFTNVTPVKEVIREKWKYYRPWFLSWFAIYLFFMGFLSYAAVLRSQMTTPISDKSTIQFTYPVTKNVFVTAISAIGLLFSALFVSMECARNKIKRFRSQTSSKFTKRIIRHFSMPYSNVMFRMYFVLFSFLLLFDFFFAAIGESGDMSGYENYCLIFAIIIGWYLVLFFLQIVKAFSFYTVLIQRVISDMIKFAFVMGIFLIAFSIAMFMIMQGANTEDEDFNNLGKTMVKMLTIMLGIGELDILFQARQPILAVTVFVLFVLLTTILLLNALIAMMSNSCTDLMSNNADVVATKMHYRLQKLSVILFLESFLPRRFCKEVGTLKQMPRYDNENNKDQIKQRRMWMRNSVHGHEGAGSDASEEPVQLTHNKIDISSLLGKILPRKKTSNKKHKVFPEIQNTIVSTLQGQQSLNRRLEITDIERTRCDTCQNHSRIVSQTQEITEFL
ncbi:transient receptor potential cation channel subfamily V member 3-like [Mercenaria mercenaria]|uniref:transient receptor potential cation channel subfamily V member 3-like n=1 Tax=Mercenaria mercenaria TaxID=6596 RepID=UPI00234E8262|nr:transient receptor potential cation channel subfamily V member 3-like [Mercenaria mercenaria]